MHSHTHTRTHAYPHTYATTSARAHTHTHVHTQAHAHKQVHLDIYVYIYNHNYRYTSTHLNRTSFSINIRSSTLVRWIWLLPGLDLYDWLLVDSAFDDALVIGMLICFFILPQNECIRSEISKDHECKVMEESEWERERVCVCLCACVLCVNEWKFCVRSCLQACTHTLYVYTEEERAYFKKISSFWPSPLAS